MPLHQFFKRVLGVGILGVLLLGIAASGASAPPEALVVASTSWTGAIARAAGANDIIILAPLELKHPPEYDYRPTDIARLAEAWLLVHAGYEPFIKKLIAASGFPQAKVVQVVTLNDPETLKKQARRVAGLLGTTAQEKAWEAAFDRITEQLRERAAQKGISRTRVLVQKHQVPFVKWLGYTIVGSFSPEELSPARILELSALKPDLIIDNTHNPQGLPIQKVVGCNYAELINFPSAHAPTLEALFKENASRLGL